MVPQLKLDKALLAIIDYQEKLLPAIAEREHIVKRVELLVRAARLLNIPILWTEQYSKGIGPTVQSVAELIGDAAQPIDKMSFGAFGDERVKAAAAQTGRSQLIVCGIEAHVCVLQTALTAIANGWTVFVVQDSVSSRSPVDRDAALARLVQAGAITATAEMVIMELLQTAEHEKFRDILKLIK